MTSALTRKLRNPDDDLTTATAMPQYTPTQVDALLIASSGHCSTIGELDGMAFYRMCRDVMKERPKLWGILRQQFTDGEVDDLMKWNMVLELLDAGVVKVEDGMLVKREREEVAA